MYLFATGKICTKPIHVAYGLKRCRGDKLERVGDVPGDRSPTPLPSPCVHASPATLTGSPTNACILSLPGLAWRVVLQLRALASSTLPNPHTFRTSAGCQLLETMLSTLVRALVMELSLPAPSGAAVL